MAWVAAPAVGDTRVIPRVPPEPSATATPFARSSATGKLSVELVGLSVVLGPIYRYPGEFWPVTVRLPVTATAAVGTAPVALVTCSAW